MNTFLFAGLLALAIARLSLCDEAELASLNNKFTLTLFNKIANENKNYISSPLSAAIVLSMLLDGANPNTDTYNEIRDTLGYTTLADMDDSYETLIANLQSVNDYQLSLANSVWVKNSFPILQTYISKMQSVFQADAKSFTDASDGVTAINSWVSDKTNSKIPSLLDSLPEGTVTVLVNAIYFQGNWVTQFNETFTAKDTFTNGNTNIQVDFMKLTADLPFKESESLNSKILHLPYKGNDTVLVLVLPNEGQTLEDTVSDPDVFLSEAFGTLPATPDVFVKIPKFKIESTFELSSPLQQLGIATAFSDSADFSQMVTGGGIKVSRVVQKAIIEVNERGSEAAAATAVVVVPTSAGLDPPEFIADRSFFYAIYHKTKATILFVGKYVGI